MKPLEFQRLAHDEQLRRSREFFDRMRTRRTVREFASEPVPYELIETAIKTACTAPSGANLQPWTFVVVTAAETKRSIREAAEVEERAFYGERAPQEWLEALEPLGTDPNKPFLEIAPYLIVVFAQHWGYKHNTDGSPGKIKHYYATESVGLACGLLLASLHQAGLATLTHTPSPMGFLREILGRPQNEFPFLLIPVGYPAENAQVPEYAQRKKPLEQVLVKC